MSYTVTTKNNYDFFECSSAFQKSIRRGDEDVALFCGVELHESGFHKYAWKRMLIMVSEDVGLANPHLPATVHALYNTYNELAKKKDKHAPERLQFIHAILLLVRSQKSRLVDWCTCDVFNDHDAKLLELPDYTFDQHTRKGKRMGRGLDHFWTEGCHLENHTNFDREDEFKQNAYVKFKNKKRPKPTPTPESERKSLQSDLFS
jgi:replication-associated recombination protein RarA